MVTAMTDGAAVDLGAWMGTFGLTHPVTMDTANLAASFGIIGLPSGHLIARGGVIHSLNTWVTREGIEQALAAGR